MQAYAQYLPDKMKKRDVCGVLSRSVSVCIFCCRTAAISASFTPLSTFHFQPLPAVATHGIDVDITFHYVISQFSAFGRLGVARRSLALLAGLAGLAVLAATTCSHPRLPAGVGGEAMGWAKPPHHNISYYIIKIVYIKSNI